MLNRCASLISPQGELISTLSNSLLGWFGSFLHLTFAVPSVKSNLQKCALVSPTAISMNSPFYEVAYLFSRRYSECRYLKAERVSERSCEGRDALSAAVECERPSSLVPHRETSVCVPHETLLDLCRNCGHLSCVNHPGPVRWLLVSPRSMDDPRGKSNGKHPSKTLQKVPFCMVPCWAK